MNLQSNQSQLSSQQNHFDEDGGDRKDPNWWKEKILSSSFLVHCRKSASDIGWTQAELAHALKVNVKYIARAECLQCETKAPLKFLIQAARVTGTPVDIQLTAD